MNSVRDKGKPRCKISYKVFKEEYGYDPFLAISPLKKNQLKDFTGGIHHCVAVFGMCIFDSNFILNY